MSERLRARVAFPGEVLGVEEEFAPDQGAFVDESGYVRSQVVGRVQVDAVRKSVSVRHFSGKPLVPRPGDVVEGVVASVSEDLAFIDIYSVNDKHARSIDFVGVLHISQASAEYVEALNEVLKLGEVVRARVLSSNYPFQLSTKEPALGVIVAYCSSCGSVLYRRDERLVCSNCGSVERRKASSFYLYR